MLVYSGLQELGVQVLMYVVLQSKLGKGGYIPT